jgi:acetyl esterase/lipase
MRMVPAALAAVLLLSACGEQASEEPEAVASEAKQWPGVPEEQAAQVREAGKVIDPASYAIFAGMVDAPPYDDVTMTSDIAYGDDPLQKLDLYTLKTAEDNGSRPVLVFVHGGGFTGGRKQGDYYPQNVTAWAARNGMVGVNIDYRLAPANTYPAASNDLAAALAWVKANIAEHGGDPDRIVLFGHSAGANVVNDYVTTPALHGDEFAGVKGALLMSPNYGETLGEEPHVYYGTDGDAANRAPALARMAASSVPVMVAYAEYDPDMMRETAEAMRAALCDEGASGNCPTFVDLANHNHLTEGASVGSVDESFTGPWSEWLATLW